jgi:predicted TPR repeat methyltransferase
MIQTASASQHIQLSEALALADQTRGYGHLAEAEALYQLILQTAPHHPLALQGLSAIKQQRNQDAAQYWNDLGDALQAINKPQQAATCYCRALVADPANTKSKALLGISYSALGKTAEATAVYKQWLQQEPDNPIAAHLYAACAGSHIPERTSDHYVETLFDDFSSDFNEHLLDHLSYQVPQLIKQLLPTLIQKDQKLHILDACCGTGLCGPILNPYAQSLTGVDLSSGMLAVAKKTPHYDVLIKEEISGFLRKNPDTFDAIIMADALIYFGSLQTLFSAASGALKTSGLFVFSVEKSPTAHVDSYLHYSGRYCHGETHVSEQLQKNGFTLISMASHTLRTELGRPIDGMLAVAIKP